MLINSVWCAEIPKSPEVMRIYQGESILSTNDYDTLLFHDNGNPQYYFPLPDEWGDQYFNVRFEAPDSCKLLQAEFYFISIQGDTVDLPDINVYVWPSTSLLPATNPGEPLSNLLAEVPVDGESISLHPDPTMVEFDMPDSLNFALGDRFHIGWEPADTAATDTILALLSDDGIPETNFSVEYWGEVGAWGTIQANWNLGVNFMIRAQVHIFEDTTSVWLEPEVIPLDFTLEGPYPNPFNPETNLTIYLQKPQNVVLSVYDLSGRFVQEIVNGTFPAGQHLVNWKPANISSGSYIIKMTSDERTISTRAILLK